MSDALDAPALEELKIGPSIRAISRSPLHNLRKLDLGAAHCPPDNLRELAAAKHLARLEELVLGDCTDEMAEILLQATFAPYLKKVSARRIPRALRAAIPFCATLG